MPDYAYSFLHKLQSGKPSQTEQFPLCLVDAPPALHLVNFVMRRSEEGYPSLCGSSRALSISTYSSSKLVPWKRKCHCVRSAKPMRRISQLTCLAILRRRILVEFGWVTNFSGIFNYVKTEVAKHLASPCGKWFGRLLRLGAWFGRPKSS